MGENKRYTWTVSVIALLDVDEPENGPIMEKAYQEFEDSITSVKNANKDIQFVIFKYDIKTETAVIRKSMINQNRYQLNTVKEKRVSLDCFYTAPYEHLIDFFAVDVARKYKTSLNEEHKHFLILWGHASGFSFLAKRVEQCLKSAFAGDNERLMVDDKEIEAIAEKIVMFTKIKSRLSLKPENIPYEVFYKNGHVNAEVKKAIDESIRSITAKEFAAILEKGLSGDEISVTSLNGQTTNQKIQVMLCLSCYVNTIDTGYALKDLVNIYIAPQTHISFFGYNYYELFKLLTKHPNSNENDIAINISHNYLRKYIKLSHKEKVTNFMIFNVDYKDDVSFSAVCLSKLEKIALLLVNFRKGTQDDRGILQQARRNCLSLSKSGFTEIAIIDYHNYILEVFQLMNDAGTFDELFIDKCYSPDYFITNYNPGIMSQKIFREMRFCSQSPGSFSIFLPNPVPDDLEKYLLEVYVTQASDFLTISGWDCLIKLVLKDNSRYPLCTEN